MNENITTAEEMTTEWGVWRQVFHRGGQYTAYRTEHDARHEVELEPAVNTLVAHEVGPWRVVPRG